MKIFLLLSALLSQTVLADTYSYQLYYDEDKTEALDIQVEVTMSGKFDSSSEVVNVKIWGEEKNEPVLLFDIPGKYIKAMWKTNTVVSLSTTKTFMPLVKEEYIPFHTDTSIHPSEEYDFEQLVLNQEGTLESDLDGFSLSNQTAEEMGLAGYLKKI